MRILRMLAVHNEADVLQRNLDWYASAGFDTVVIDNESTDASSEICARAVESGAILALRRLETNGFDWTRILTELLELARALRPDYVFLTAADEFFEVADGSDLRSAMEEDFAAGFTVLKFCNMEFAMTRADPAGEPDPVARMRHYSHRRTGMGRAYPCLEGLDIAAKLGHQPVFPAGVREIVSPRAYVSRHYPLRTPEQALAKIRRVTYDPERDSGHQYLHLTGRRRELYAKPKDLARYDEDHMWDFEPRPQPQRAKQTLRALRQARMDLARLEDAHQHLQRRYAELERRLERREPAPHDTES
jgi:hypothetical protein